MNLHVLRTYEAIAEAKELMSVPTQMISPQSNKPIIGLVQDSLVSVYLLTLRDTLLTRAQMMQMVMPIAYPLFTDLPPPCILKPVALWSGKQLFSLLLPCFNMDVTLPSGVADGVDKRPDGVMDVGERRVVIRGGELMAGTLCKKTMGTSPGHIIHTLVKDCGNDLAAKFVGDAQRLLVEYMLIRGFSVGVGDCLMSDTTHAKVVGSINRSLAYVDDLLSTQHGKDSPQLLESCVTRVMTGVLTRVGAVVQEDLQRENQVHIMVTSGAKGSSVNIAQILGCVGQQSVEGSRIAPDIHGRTLPCYKKGQQTAESRGFVANSYGTGLTAQEYFFHAMGGREGLVDTAVKTASTGYIQRRLVKAKEGLQVRYDHTVRNTRDQIVQFYYGGDSFDPVFVEKQVLKTFAMSDDAVRELLQVTPDELARSLVGAAERTQWDAWAAAVDAEVVHVLHDRDVTRQAKLKLASAPGAEIFVTVTPLRAVNRALAQFGIHRSSRSDVAHPSQVTSLMHQLFSSIQALRRHEASFYTVAYLRATLTLRFLVVEKRLTLAALQWLVDDLMNAYRRSLINPGEMVGTLGAASIGEPCTQMTLNTFHTAGVAERTVTLGVPRLKELIDTTRPIRTPSLTVYLHPLYSQSERMARKQAVALEYTLLYQVVLTSSVEHDPDPWHTVIADDAEMVDAYRALLQEDGEDGGGNEVAQTDFVIRFVLNRDALVHKQLTVVHVAQALMLYLKDKVTVMRSEVNMPQWCLRVRVSREQVATFMENVQDVDDEERAQLERAAIKTMHDFLLDNVAVSGVAGITRAMVRHHERAVVDAGSGALHRTREWMADTEGTNLRTVLTLPFVDKRNTISNDIHEVLEVLGIEAAQHMLVEELRTVLSFDGSYVNERHLQLLADVMTLSGTLTAMTRHSMHKLGGSTYHHASFEETQDVLIQAAAFGMYDHISGVTENLMMGQLMPGGTGACDVISTQPVTPAAPVQHVKPLLPVPGTTRSSGGGMIVKPLVTETCPAAMVVKPLAVMQQAAKVTVKPLVTATVQEKKGGKETQKHVKRFIPLSPALLPQGKFMPLSPVFYD